MSTMPESLARVQMSTRLGEAQRRRLGYQLARQTRVSRKAQQAARQSRMALAQAL